MYEFWIRIDPDTEQEDGIEVKDVPGGAYAVTSCRLKGDPKKNAKQITKIQGQIDKLNSDSQLDMIKLQSLTNKRNQTFEMMSNLTQKFSQSCDKMIGNIR